MTEPKFKLGQVVFVPWATACAQKMAPCPICAGKAFVTLILGSGEHAHIECQACGIGRDRPQGTVITHTTESGILECRITGISNDFGSLRYEAGNSRVEESEIFLTAADAEPLRAAKFAEAEVQVQRNFESQFKEKKNGHGWSLYYHRKEIARLEASLAWHRAKLTPRNVNGQHPKSLEGTLLRSNTNSTL